MLKNYIKAVEFFFVSKPILWLISKVLFYVLVNVFLVLSSLKLYSLLYLSIVRYTEDRNDLPFEIFFLIAIITLFTLAFTKNKIIRKFGVGMMSLLMVFILFLVFTINKEFGSIGKYYDYKIIEANNFNKKNYLDILYNNKRVSMEVDLEDCLTVDFLKIRIDNGLFGMPFITGSYKLEENYNCNKFEIKDSSTYLNNHAQYHLKAGHYYARIRCFTSAIEHYTYSIIQDSLNENSCYNRGLMYSVKHDYKKALKDFYSAAIIANCKIDTNLLSKSKGLKIDDVLNNLMENSESIDFKDLESFMYKLTFISNNEDYKTYINYCIEKIKNKDQINLKDL